MLKQPATRRASSDPGMGTLSDPARRFLQHLEDKCTGGPIPHYGIPRRSRPVAPRVLMSTPSMWQTHEGVHLNTKEENGPHSYRAAEGITDPGQELPSRVIVIDCDEGKAPHPRPPGEILRLAPPGWAAIVPSKTRGCFQIIYCIHPAPRDEAHAIGRALAIRLGADTNFSNSLSWNPIYRELNPSPSGETTQWWNRDVASTPLPVHDLNEWTTAHSLRPVTPVRTKARKTPNPAPRTTEPAAEQPRLAPAEAPSGRLPTERPTSPVGQFGMRRGHPGPNDPATVAADLEDRVLKEARRRGIRIPSISKIIRIATQIQARLITDTRRRLGKRALRAVATRVHARLQASRTAG